jgi:two-component system, NtrC family, sensor kinase
MKVLIADDDSVSRKLLQSYLQKWGCEVSVARDGAEAWSCFEREEFSLVITDWVMPALDGVELVRRIRSVPRPGYVYVILLTAKGEKEDLVEGMEAGADDFLTKPFDRDELRVRLRAGERIVGLEQQLRAARGGSAPELERRIAEVIDDLSALRREVLAALRGETGDQAGLHEGLARRFDRSLAELRRLRGDGCEPDAAPRSDEPGRPGE